jgi:hypothetical protein
VSLCEELLLSEEIIILLNQMILFTNKQQLPLQLQISKPLEKRLRKELRYLKKQKMKTMVMI